jgi:hypothetical protein
MLWTGESALTEHEFLTLTRPARAAEQFASRSSPLRTTTRKARLFACACCRRVWDHLRDGGRAAVEAAERAADGLIRVKDLKPYCMASPRVIKVSGTGVRNPANYAAVPFAWVDGGNAAEAAAQVFVLSLPHVPLDRRSARDPECRAQCDLLRDILGNPFRHQSGPAFRAAGTARNLALSIYEKRSFDDLPILADALEDAGCTDADLLSHLRGPGPHVRGCWALDLLLGKR